MNSITEDSGGHALDGIDPDAPRIWLSREDRQWCADAVQDVKALREMSEADIKRYAGTPRGRPLNDNRKR